MLVEKLQQLIGWLAILVGGRKEKASAVWHCKEGNIFNKILSQSKIQY
jgi:hypothetical protein